MFISLISWNNLLKRFNPAEEPLYRVAFFVEFWIEPDWPSSLRIFPGSPVDRDIALNSPVPIVLTNFPGIVGRICGDDREANRDLRNPKCLKGWFVELGTMDIGRRNRADKRETVSIDQSTQFVPVYFFIAIIAS